METSETPFAETMPAPDSNKNSPSARLGQRLKTWLERLSSLRGKLIVPYVILSLLVALVGIYVVTRLAFSSLNERFVNVLYEATRVAADGMARQERENLSNLSTMVFTVGVSEALANRDREVLNTLLMGLMAVNGVDFMTVVDSSGLELLTLSQDQDGTQPGFSYSQNVDLSGIPIIANILQGTQDEFGDKYVGIFSTNQGYVLATSAPVYADDNTLVGVIVVGEYLDDLLANIKSQALGDVILLDNDGKLVVTTFAEAQDVYSLLEGAGRQAQTPNASPTQDLDLFGRLYKVHFTDLRLREQPVGLLGVALGSNYVYSAEATSRNIFSLVFTLGTAGTILLGYILAQNIARPILRLRSLSQSVAAGDLDQSSGLERNDEIGDLADAFDRMTDNLRERTAEAERLYEETVQRNKELAAINTRLQETQLQLIQSEKLAAIGQLTAGIVHDVKNPLTVIKGTAELLQEDETLPEDMQKALSLIREGAVKANRIVSDLLKFARQAQPELKAQDLRETVQAALRLTTYLTRQAQVRVQSELPEQPVMAIYDAQQIEQVFINLITNAAQATPEKGSLRVALSQSDQLAVATFEDTGSGIPPANLHRIFDPFFTTKPEGQGTGLGLSVSYGIVASHNGRIEVESEVGKGTTFTIYLPLETSAYQGEMPDNGSR